MDRRAVETVAIGEAAFAIAVFTGIVLANAILAILLIEFFQSIGWWEASAASEGAAEAASELSGRHQ